MLNFRKLKDFIDDAKSFLIPPEWFVLETQNKLVLLLNHVIGQNKKAQQELKLADGKIIGIKWQDFSINLKITPIGLFNLASTEEFPDLFVKITQENPLELIKNKLNNNKLSVHIEGDGQLASIINYLVENLDWDVQQDLEKIIGEIPAEILTALMQKIAETLKIFCLKFKASKV